jgi:hypothetical protein
MVHVSEHRQIIAAMLVNPGSMATLLHAIIFKEFGEEMYNWEPETIYLDINDAFDIQIPEANFNKLMALVSALSSDAFYKKWSSFDIICGALSDGDPSGDDELLVAEMAWGIIEVGLNDETPSEFSHDIAAAVGALLVNEGFTSPPASLSFAAMPEVYHGSDSGGDLRREDSLSTEHAAVVTTFIQEQAALLVSQLSALPWHNEESLVEIISQVTPLAS